MGLLNKTRYKYSISFWNISRYIKGWRNINRFVNFSDIKEKVLELESLKNIDQHLDLIAGLPGEDYDSFKKSFNEVYEYIQKKYNLVF